MLTNIQFLLIIFIVIPNLLCSFLLQCIRQFFYVQQCYLFLFFSTKPNTLLSFIGFNFVDQFVNSEIILKSLEFWLLPDVTTM